MATQITLRNERKAADVVAVGRPVTSDHARTGVAALVAALVVVRIAAAWNGAADSSPTAVVALLVASVLLLGVVVFSAVPGSPRLSWGLDGALLLAAATVVCTEQRAALSPARSYPSDEGRLVRHAIAAIAHGHNPYARSYPDVANFAGNTPFFGGGRAHVFGYPPLTPELGALLGHLHAAWGTPATTGLVGLLATAVVCLVVLPPMWRTVGVGAALGLTPLTVYAVNGHPVMLALPLLCLACARWSRLGADGRLGVVALLQAGCLGLSAAAQQLAWFPALGLLVSLWLLRRGPLGDRAALLLVARFALVALAAFVIVNLPFVVTGPRSWLHGMLAPFVGPPAVATGQGLVALAVSLRHGGGAFQYFSYATLLLLIGMLVVIALGFRRLAAAVPVLLTLIFLVSVRSQGEYFLAFVPLWVVWAAGTDPRAVHAVPTLVPTRWTAVLATAALVPAVACVAAAVAVPAPLRLTVTATSMRDGRIASLRVSVENRSAARIAPHFYLDPASHLRSPWTVFAGPRSLAPGRRATLTLRPALLGPERATPSLRVWALADGPESMSSAPVRVHPLAPTRRGR